jgi:competence ComEA-like helix-hairpin-helix protein
MYFYYEKGGTDMQRKVLIGIALVGVLLGNPAAWSESPQGSPQEGTSQGSKGSKVNINTADAATLAKLPGVGEKNAAAIIEYRTKNGSFKVIDDLKLVPGMSELTVERLGERRLTVGDE